jgi:hypothetical protein
MVLPLQLPLAALVLVQVLAPVPVLMKTAVALPPAPPVPPAAVEVEALLRQLHRTSARSALTHSLTR